MKHEHKLTPTQALYIQQAREQITKLRPEYLMALGRVKELEQLANSIDAGVKQQIQLIVQDLPGQQYQLTEDGKMLVGEVPDAPPAPAPNPALKPELVPDADKQLVNGAPHAES